MSEDLETSAQEFFDLVSTLDNKKRPIEDYKRASEFSARYPGLLDYIIRSHGAPFRSKKQREGYCYALFLKFSGWGSTHQD